MNVLLIGSLNTIFIYSYCDYFLKKGCEVFVINTSDVVDVDNTRYNGFNLYNLKSTEVSKFSKIKKIISKIKLDTLNVFWWLYSFFVEKKTLPNDSFYKIEKLLLSDKFDLAFCFWGTSLRKEILALRKIVDINKLKLKLILSVSTYPTRYNVPKSKSLSWLYLKKDINYFNCCDGLILSGRLMKNVIVDYLGYNGNYIIFKDYLISDYFAVNPGDDKKDIIFLGNVRFDERTIDNVSKQLLDIADKGIIVWIQESSYIKHKNIKMFKPFSLEEITQGKLGEFLSKFKASVVLYNKVDNLRMGTTFPTRFALATLGHHQIYLPKGVFDSLEEFGNDVILYEDIPGLVEEYINGKIDCKGKRERFFLDSDSNSLVIDDFINDILTNNG